MTSRSSFSEFSAITRNRISRGAWLFTLWSVALFLFIPVVQALIVSEGQFNAAESSSYAINMVNTMFDPKKNVIIILTAIMGLLSGAAMFAFADSPRQCDFYFAQPVSRRSLFLSNWLSGFLIFAVPMIAAILLAAAVTCIGGCSKYLDFGLVLSGLGYQLLVFLVIYDFTVFWCVVCGNMVISLLCTVYSMVIGSALWLELLYYKARFFDTFDASELNGEIAAALCPVAPFVMLRTDTEFITDWRIPIAVWSVVAVALGAAAMGLFCIRPAEKAGKPLAFPKALPFVKYPLTVCAAIVGGIVFREITQSFGWELFGYLLFGAVAFLLINVLEKFDFKNITKNLWKLGVLAVVTALLITAVGLDIFGYDRRLPSRSSIGAVRAYSLSGDFGDGYAGYSAWSCKLTNAETLDLFYALSKEAVKQNIGGDTVDREDTVSFSVDYQTAAGRFMRSYTLRADDATDKIVAALTANEDFIKSGINVWQFEAENIREATYWPGKMQYADGEWYNDNKAVFSSDSASASLVKAGDLLAALRADLSDPAVKAAVKSSDYLGYLTVYVNSSGSRRYEIPIYSCYTATLATRLGPVAEAANSVTFGELPAIEVRRLDGAGSEYFYTVSEQYSYAGRYVETVEQAQELYAACVANYNYDKEAADNTGCEPNYEVVVYDGWGNAREYYGIKAGSLPDFVEGLFQNG